MSTPTKPRGSKGPLPELTKFKLLWRDALDERARDFWRSRFASADTQSALRKELAVKLKINLSQDSQLTSFRDWLAEQDAMDQEAERQAEEETRLAKDHPDWDPDRLRQEVISGSLRRAIVTGNFEALGLRAVKAGQNEKVIALDRDKFEFDATKLALAKLDTLKTIKANSKLTEEEKLKQARLELFGIAPK